MEELKKSSPLHCNWCGKGLSELSDARVKLNRSYEYKTAICDVCVDTIHQDCPKDIRERKKTKPAQSISAKVLPHQSKLYTPVEILSLLDKHIAGQNEAKMAISLAVSNHLRSHISGQKKSNVLILGPSGTGKTEIARALSKELSIPLYVHDATNLTTSGYVGNDVESILVNLYHQCGNDLAKTESAIVFIDEIDKKADRGRDSGDIGTSMVQDALLKMIEGDKVVLKLKNEKIVINTAKILFICAGAFSGIKLETTSGRSIGVNSSQEMTKKEINLRDALHSYGMKPEFVRRFSIITKTNAHTEESLSKILDGKENSILARYEALYSSYGLELRLDKDFRQSIIENAMKSPLPVAEMEQSFEDFSQKVFFDPKLLNNFKVTLTTNGHVFNKKRKVKV